MLSPGQTVDRYTVEAVIGHGGTAVVYLVRHNQLKSQHALKVLSLTSGAIRERLLREGRVQAALQHANIVTVTDVLDIDGNPGLLMEHVDGPSLDQAMKRYKISLSDALTLFRGVVAGVRAAHRQGLVHRDLKPANVLLFRSPEGFVPKVTDFGLAKLLVGADQELGQTRQGIAMGTPAYMAPEQIRDARAVDQRADIFSLGCILYELVTRQRAFPGDQALDIYNDIVAGRYAPPEEIAADLPDAVIQAIDGCLIRDRELRIPDCEALLEVLAGRRTWPVIDHPVPDELSATEEVGDAPMMPVATRKLTPMPAPERHVAPTGATDVDGTLADGAPRRRRGRVAIALAVLAVLVVIVGVGGAYGLTRVVRPALRPPEASEPAIGSIDAGPPSALPAPEPPADDLAALGAAAGAPSAGVAPASAPRRPAIDDDPPQPIGFKPPDPVEPVPVAAAPAPARAEVEVRLFSDPLTVAIAVDGRDLGRTPRKLALAPGVHRVRVTSGGESGDFPIRVEPGGDDTWCYSFPQRQVFTGRCP
jgi:hypothetical protein